MPANDECVEAFQWVAQEIQKSYGQALVMHVEQFDGLSDQQLIDLFRASRKEDYAEIEAQAAELEKAVNGELDAEIYTQIHASLAKLQRQYVDVARIDYFDSAEGRQMKAQLARIAESLSPNAASEPDLALVNIDAYRQKRWVTRPQPHVDRLACAWLIRRFINPDAVIRYSLRPEPDEVAFDMNEAEFGHLGNLCSFETMIRAFGLEVPELAAMAEIIHEVDLRDERYVRPEASGIDAVLRGWLLLNIADEKLELSGTTLFDGLFESLQPTPSR